MTRPSPTPISAKPPVGRRMRRRGPKMAALLAAAAEPAPEFSFVNLTSDGVILIYGRDQQAIEAGNLLKDHLDVTVLIKPPADVFSAAGDRLPRGKGRDPFGQGLSRQVRIDGRRLRPTSPVIARRVQLPNDATARCRAAISCSTSPAAHRYSLHRTCETAICGPIPAIPRPSSRPC